MRYKDGRFDSVDTQLIRALASNARTSIADLARQIGLSSPGVSERIKRLEEAGVITGYTLTVNPKLLGKPVAAWLRIRPSPGQLSRVASILANLPDIVECDRITGDDCFLARAYVESVEKLEELIDELIPYASTNTSVVQSSPVKQRLPPLGRTE